MHHVKLRLQDNYKMSTDFNTYNSNINVKVKIVYRYLRKYFTFKFGNIKVNCYNNHKLNMHIFVRDVRHVTFLFSC